MPDGPSHSPLLTVPSKGRDAHFGHMSLVHPLSLKKLMVTQDTPQDIPVARPESVEQGHVDISTPVTHGVALRMSPEQQRGAAQVPGPKA